MPDYLPSSARSHALLIGAGHFPAKGFPELPQAQANLTELAAALSEGEQALLLPSGVTCLPHPQQPWDVSAAVLQAAKRTSELLIVYYTGHGYIDTDQELYLAVGRSTKDTARHTAVRCSDLLSQLADSGVERFVLVLDCCFSGNIFDCQIPTKRPFAVLTSAPYNREISQGQGNLTPFTEQLVDILRHGVSEPHSRATVQAVGRELELRSRDHQPPDTVYPWHPTEISHQAGNTVLSLALGGAGPLERALGKLRSAGRRAAAYPAAAWQWFFGRGRPLWRRWLGSVLALALLAAGGVTGYVLTRPGPCPPPLELRVLTEPEEVVPLSGAADAYERSPQNHQDTGSARNCRTTHLTVYGAGLDAIARAFHEPGAWNTPDSRSLTEVGPQPDLWIPQSSVSHAYVAERIPTGYGLFGPATRIAGSPTVLAVSEAARTRLGLGPSGSTVDWAQLRTRWLALQTPPVLLRSNPTVSGAGLIQTIGLYRDVPATAEDNPVDDLEHTLPTDQVLALERRVIGQGRSAQDGYGLLCELRQRYRQTHGYGPVAALVSPRELNAMEAGEPLGDQCPDSGPSVKDDPGTRLARYTLRGMPPLDYPAIPVSWPDAADAEQRADAVDRFVHWLTAPDGQAELARAGYGPGGALLDGLSASGVDTRLDEYRYAHPNLRLQVLFDVSASMAESGKLEQARSAVEASLRRLADSDVYRLRTFPSGTDLEGSRDLRPDDTRVTRGAAGTLPPLTVAGTREADLYRAVKDVLSRLPAPSTGWQNAILLVTDGDWLRNQPPTARTAALQDLTKSLALAGVPVLVAAMRPYGCAREAAAIASAAVGGGCVAASDDLATRLPQLVAALTKGRVVP